MKPHFEKIRNSTMFNWRVLVCSIAVSATVATCSATAEISDEKRAVVAFDFNLEAVRSERLNQLMPIDDGINRLLKTWKMPPFKVETITNFRGAIGFPSELAALQQVSPGDPIPIELLIEIEFDTREDCDRIFDSIFDEAKSVNRNSVEYFSPASKSSPANVLFRRKDKRTFEVVTDAYAGIQLDELGTDRLKVAWNDMQESAVRVAADVETARPLLNEALTQFLNDEKRAGRKIEKELLVLSVISEQVSTINLFFNPAGDELLSMAAEAMNEAKARTVADGVNSVLSQLKFLNRQFSGDTKTEKFISSLYQQLDAKVKDSRVTILIRKPKGFDESLINSIDETKYAAQVEKKLSRFRSRMIDVMNYHDRHFQFPWEPVAESDESNRLSWRVRLAMKFDRNLVGKIDLTQSYNTPENEAFAKRMPAGFGSDGANADLSIITLKRKRLPRTVSDVTDGASKTVMLIENRRGVPWMQPNDLTIDEAIEMVKRLPDEQFLWVCFYDYSARLIGNDVPEETLRRLFDPTDGKEIEGFFD